MRLLLILLLMLLSAGVLSGCITHRVRGAFFDARGVPIHYTDEGKGDPVILVHGVAVNADFNWRRPGIIKTLKKEYRVIAFDDRGHGLSGKPYGINQYGTEMVEDVIRLMDHLGLEKAHVAGYSMGGFITLKLLATHPDRLKSAMVCGAGWEQMTPERRAHLAAVAAAIRQKRDYAPLLAEVGLLKKGFFPIKALVANALLRHINDSAAVADVMDSLAQLEVSKESLLNNTVPTLSIVGDRDTLKRGVDAMDNVMANRSVLVIPGGDHYTALMDRNFKKGMVDFLAQQTNQ
jgi:pimeloyl-ACP methyl ester carboxylesterase